MSVGRLHIYGFMNEDAELERLVQALKETPKEKKRPTKQQIAQRTELAPDAPAPALNSVIATRGLDPTTRALEAWNARVAGAPIVDVAYQLGCSIELARELIAEVHRAVFEDLKANVDLNRQLDLYRIDSIIKAFLPGAKAGDPDAANVLLRCIGQRSKLTGQEPEGRDSVRPTNVLVWLQQSLPSIHKIVDELPIE
jgi:hypothetical protein